MNKLQIYFALLFSAILLLISCEDDILRNNRFDPESDNTIIGSISGIVSPVSSNATVSAIRGSKTFESTSIESDGKFELTNLPEGNYTIVVEAENFLTDSSLTNIVVTPKETFSVGTLYINSAIHGTISGKVEPYNSNVQINLMKDGSQTQSTKLNDNSEFNFSMLDPGIYSIEISLNGYSTYENDQINVSAGITTNLGTVILNDISEGSISGFVSPKSSSALVFLYSGSTAVDSVLIEPLTGQYLFTNLEPSTYDIIITADGFAMGELFGLVVVTGETNEGNNILLEETGSIKGTVYPISSNALVAAYSGEDFITSTNINSIDGSYTLQNVSPGYYDLVISADGRITDESLVNKSVDAGNLTNLDRIYLAPTGSNALFGKVTSQDSENPISGAELTIDNNSSTTDIEGYYVFYSLSSGNKNVQIEKNGYLSTISSVSVPATGTTKTNFTMVSAGTLSGTITDNQSADGVDGARISIDNDDFVTFTNASGNYLFEGLPSGNHNVIVTKNGYNSANSEITIISGVTSTLDLSLISLNLNTGSLSGNVIDFYTNQNIEDVTVVISGMVGLTSASGNFEIVNIPIGSHGVQIEHADYISQSTNTTINANQNTSLNFSLVLKDSSNSIPTGTVSGVLRDFDTNEIIDHTGTEGIYLTYQSNLVDPYYYSFVDGALTNGEFSIYNLTAGDNYLTPNIPIGTYHLWLMDYHANSIGTMGYKGFDMIIEVTEGANYVEPKLKKLCSIGGVVTNLSTGLPIEGVNVLGTTTDGNGSYYKNRIDPDISTISYSGDGYYTENIDVSLVSGQHHIFNVSLSSLPFVSGTVTDASTGLVLPEVEITSSDAITTFSDSNGSFEIDYSSDGESSINFAKQGYSNYSTSLNIPYTGSITLNVELEPND